MKRRVPQKNVSLRIADIEHPEAGGKEPTAVREREQRASRVPPEEERQGGQRFFFAVWLLVTAGILVFLFAAGERGMFRAAGVLRFRSFGESEYFSHFQSFMTELELRLQEFRAGEGLFEGTLPEGEEGAGE